MTSLSSQGSHRLSHHPRLRAYLGLNSLTTIIKRLEAATSRLEDLSVFVSLLLDTLFPPFADTSSSV
jgi:hypothetical protein